MAGKIVFIMLFIFALCIPFVPESIKAGYVVLWFASFLLALVVFRPDLRPRYVKEKDAHELSFERRLQMSCKHLTRLSSVIVTCNHCGERFLKVERLPTVNCPACGRSVIRQREPSGICDIDGVRVSKDQLTKCLNLDGMSVLACPKTTQVSYHWNIEYGPEKTEKPNSTSAKKDTKKEDDTSTRHQHE